MDKMKLNGLVKLINIEVLRNTNIVAEVCGEMVVLSYRDDETVNSNGVNLSPLQEEKIVKAVRRWFDGCLPCFNLTKGAFYLEKAVRHAVCVLDKDKAIYRSKVVDWYSALSEEDAKRLLGYYPHDNIQVIKCEPLGKPIDGIPLPYWELLMADGDFFVERNAEKGSPHFIVQKLPQ